MSSVLISKLSVERYESGFGIGHASPRLSWRFGGSPSNWVQASYDVKVEKAGKTEEYHVDSEGSLMVPWPSAPLVSREQAKVSVQATGTDGSSTGWTSFDVETAFIDSASEWKAATISGEAQSTTESKRPFILKKTFKQEASAGKARLYITALGVYEAKINGKLVGDHVLGPGWQSYNHRLHYQTFDVGSLLKQGENEIEILVGEGWYAGRLGFHGGKRDLYGADIGATAQLEIDGTTISTDSTWSWSYGAIINSEIYDGEVFDSQKQDSAGYKWQPVRVIDSPKGKLISPEAPPVRRTQEVKPIERIITPAGKIVLDFGQNLVGWIKIINQPTGVSKGDSIVFSHAEVMEKEELGIRPLRVCKATDTITAGGDLAGWEPTFTFHGFRYAQIDGWKDVKLEDVVAVVVHTDMERLGEFKCSHEMINRLHENTIWGLRGNFLSVPTDCPQRDERLGWTGDAQAIAQTASFLYGVDGIMGNWLDDLWAEQKVTKTFCPGLVIPDILGMMGFGPKDGEGFPQAVWQDVTALAPKDLYEAFGDVRVLQDQHESMVSWLDKAIFREPGTNLWRMEGFPQLADWLDPAAPPDAPENGSTDPILVANAFLVWTTKAVSDISKILGKTADAERYAKDHADLRATFQKEYITSNGRITSDSQCAYILCLKFGLLEPEQIPVAVKRLKYLIRKRNFMVGTGFAATPVILQTLADFGEIQYAYRMLQDKKNPSWLYPVSMGATTIWERYDSMLPDGSINPGEMTSFNHYALGSVMSFAHRYIGGISPTSPGWKTVLIKPQPGGTISSASVSHISPYGKISCEWQIEGDKLNVQIEVPPSTTAKVVLPGKEEEVGSGSYTYSVEWKKDESWPPVGEQGMMRPPIDESYVQ